MDFDSFFNAFLVCALWSSTDESDENGGEPLDSNYGVEDFTMEARENMESIARKFFDEHHDLMEICSSDESQHGADFWLTANGHGAGFWDRGYDEKCSRILCSAAKEIGDINIYANADGKIEIY